MPTLTHALGPDEPFIELNKLLKLKDIAQSGGHAKAMIEEGLVYVNGEVEYRKRNKLRAGAQVEVEGQVIEVVGGKG